MPEQNVNKALNSEALAYPGRSLIKHVIQDFTLGGSRTHGLFRLVFHPLTLLPKSLDHVGVAR